MKIFLVFIFFMTSLLLTKLVRHYALHKAILDIPNERSSHQLPMPRVGGLAIVFSFLFAVVLLAIQHNIPKNLCFALLGGGLLTAAVGYCDDIKKINARWRILIHLFAAVWALYWLKGFPILNFGNMEIYVGWLGFIFAIIVIVWAINLYNFMDGIDGFAGSEGVFVSFCAAIFLWWSGDYSLAFISIILAATIGGFLCWNWPPAKIFMGDVGSGFLGFIFAVIALYSVNQHKLSLVFWAILFAVFVYDATLTVIYRVYQRKAWYKAHREHAYQKLIIYGMSHRQVTLGLIIINFVVLYPAAFTVFYWPSLSFWVLGVLSLGFIIVWGYTHTCNKRQGLSE